MRFLIETFKEPIFGYVVREGEQGIYGLGFFGFRVEPEPDVKKPDLPPEAVFFLETAPDWGEFVFRNSTGWIFSSSKPRVPHWEVIRSFCNRTPHEFFKLVKPDCSNVLHQKVGLWGKCEQSSKESLREFFLVRPFDFKDYALKIDKRKKKQ